MTKKSLGSQMRIIFIHQNMPGQYKHLAPKMAQQGHEVIFVTRRRNVNIPGVRRIIYDLAREPDPKGHVYARQFDSQLLYGQAVARTLIGLRNDGFMPDLICAHSGWGEALFVKEVFPECPLQIYSEYYYRGLDSDVGFEEDNAPSIDAQCRARARNAHMLISAADADAFITPTKWQWKQHPSILRDRMSIIHDGIDSRVCRPNSSVTFTLPTGEVLSRDDEIITYMARNLEPYRGFHKFMETLEILLKLRPRSRVVIIGGDETSYGHPPKDGGSWREHLLPKFKIDPLRVHFIGRVNYEEYIKFIQISRVHLYYTYPFILSWSAMEAMAAGCAIVASGTPPVHEVMQHGSNSLLFDFSDAQQAADHVCRLLESDELRLRLGTAARKTILNEYDLHSIALPKQIENLTSLANNV